ncbi:ectonucleoside triphosphate diphosphohydrolase 3 [Latimeria chalumnae]|uniref:ectonucleoside triphosphate diphosphohydrolase 3 n=1 Tax=Latimeria chalumnae TaxID=7897 RepID=UPI0006D90DCC|nr:PREDICTED: ectonucleoside triphosphate diphosphohydrolase 3 isoform X1 [Latimeria chalumnae]|eukprot:XP_014343043.1 PREDICTED: ectonucleoside triphosphate diphosphohydrolase 3 isoform X1 [Latimeria chalumnae]
MAFFLSFIGSKMGSKAPVIAASVLLLVSVVVIITIAAVQINKKQIVPPGLKYGIVIDAGSSRTTVYVYSWPAEKENNTGVVKEAYKCNVTGPGISSYASNPPKAARSLEACMNETKKIIPVPLHKDSPVYLGATAGMRLLKLQNETAANAVLSSIEDYFKFLPFDFRSARIITEQEEGVFAWITANYFLDNFLEKNVWNAWVRRDGSETVGALDLGGASTQIAFIPKEPTEGLNSTVMVTLYGYQYEVYTHSFQCYGKNEIEKRFLAILVQTSLSVSMVDNPCYPRGYHVSFMMGNIFQSLCTESQRPEKYNPEQTVTFVGTGDPAVCKEKVSLVFNFPSCDRKENCSFDGVYQPSINGKFVAFAGFYYITEALNLTGKFPLDTFNSTVWSFCSQNWIKLQAILPNAEEKYIRSYCFAANYIYNLLVRGYKFDSETWPQISFQRNAGNNSITWSLGYMLNLTNMIPAEGQLIHLPMTVSVFVGLLFLFVALAILCLMFLIISVIRQY